VVPRLSLDALRSEVTFTRTTIGARRLALHVTLLLLTFFTTTVVGVVLTHSFQAGRPVDLDQYVAILSIVRAHPLVLLDGIAFSLTLMTILLAHEMGHYFACRYYGIDATLPFFLPAPTPIGTLGAFIRIRSPIYTRRALFDVGIAGPIAGFVLLLPALAIGIAESKVIPGIANQGDLVFGVPAVQRALEWLILPGVRSSDIYLHPVGRAAWVGILATALNLLPIGQLDGGHILYSFVGRWHKYLSRVFVSAMAVFAITTHVWSWLVWAVLLFFFALRHPAIYDVSNMGANRVKLGLVALAIFLLTFTLVPIH
jgi:membrane-associated protease RseP (regulator of RpoE activity)